MSRNGGLVLPRASTSKAPSPGSSTPQPSAAAGKDAAPVASSADAIRHFADADVQSLVQQATAVGDFSYAPAADSPAAGPSTAASPSGTNVQALEDAARGPSGILPTLQNLVATVDLAVRLDLKTIALHARNAEYNPKRFAAVIMRIREPKTTALVFASGKMVITGARSEDECKLAARKYARIIVKLGFEAQFKDYKVQNCVGSCDIKFPVRLEGLAYAHGHFSSYEPELFPGLIYRMVKPKVVLLIFASGKIVLTGAKTRDEIYTAFNQIYPVLAEFRKNAPQQ